MDGGWHLVTKSDVSLILVKEKHFLRATVTSRSLSLLISMHNRVKVSHQHIHCDALFGHLAANQKAVNDQALVENACNISSFGICSVLQSW